MKQHCWNEDKKEWYEIETIGVNEYRCLGCFGKLSKEEYDELEGDD